MRSLGRFTNGEQCKFDLSRETRLLVQANSGGGKSWLLRCLFENTAGHVQQIIIDPEGEFSSLREKFDYVIAAPHGGDALAHPKTAQLLARRLLETGVSAILDIYDLKKKERQLFVKLFCEALVEAPKSLWHPALIAIDEIHLFCPEKGHAESTQAVIDLATRGRKRGFSLIGATQRLAKFNKDAAAELINKLVGRTSLDVDVRRAMDELGFSSYREAFNILRNLNPGEFFAFGPALSPTIEQLRVGPVLTTHPKIGDQRMKAPPKPTAAIRAVLPKLADLPKEAETEARTVAQLRQEVVGLRRELSQARRASPTPAVPTRPAAPAREALVAAEERGFQRGMLAQRTALAQERRALKSAVLAAVQNVFSSEAQSIKPAPVAGTSRAQGVATRDKRAPSTPLRPAHERAAAAAPATGRKEFVLSGDAQALSGPEQRILNAIAWFETMLGTEACPQPAVAFAAGYAYGGGAYNNPRGRLHKQGLVEYAPGERIALTDAGRALAEAPETPLTEDELHRRVLERLPGPEQRILKPLLESYPQPMEGPAVAQAANYVFGAGSFNNPRGRLRSYGLIEYVGNGQLIASDCLFPGRSRTS